MALMKRRANERLAQKKTRLALDTVLTIVQILALLAGIAVAIVKILGMLS